MPWHEPYKAELMVSLPKRFIEREEEEDALDLAVRQAKNLYNKENYSDSFRILYEAWKDTGFNDRESIRRLYSDLMRKGRVKCLAFYFQKELLKGHTHTITSIALTPDGRYAVSGSADKTLRVWDLETGTCTRTFEGHTGEIWSVAITPDGRYAVSGSSDKTLRVWGLETGRCSRTLEGHTGVVWSVAITPDGRFVVSGGEALRVWDLEIGQCIRTLERHTDQVSSLAITPDRLSRLGKGKIALEKARIAWEDQVSSLAITPDGRYAVSGSMDKTLRVWDLETGRCTRTLKGHTGKIWSVAITPDGRYAVSGSGGTDGKLRVWDLEIGQCISTIEGYQVRIQMLGMTPDERQIINVQSVTLTPDGRYAVSGGWDATLRVWDLAIGQCVHTLEGHSGGVSSIILTPDGRYVVSGSHDTTLRVWGLIWDLEFPESVDWDEGVRPYLEIFLTLRNGKWTE